MGFQERGTWKSQGERKFEGYFFIDEALLHRWSCTIEFYISWSQATSLPRMVAISM